MRKLMSTLLVIMLAFMLGGCAGSDIAALWENSGPKEKAIFLTETYNAQYDQYIDAIAYATGMTAEQVKALSINDPAAMKEAINSSSLTEEARMTLRYKKGLLEQLDMPVEEFAHLAQAGLPTSAEQEKFILEVLNKLKYRAYTN